MQTLINRIALFSLVAASFTIGCNNNASRQQPEESKEVAEDKNDAKFKTDSSEHNAQFAVDAAIGNLTEIRLAELGQQKSTNKEIKEIAKMLYDDHTAALNDLKVLASNKSISIPADVSDDTKQRLQKLTDEKPSSFDKDWTEQLMEEHQKTISNYESALGTVSDADIKNWINTVLPKIRTHHDKLMALNSRLKK
jgi:putative membrane protein